MDINTLINTDTINTIIVALITTLLGIISKYVVDLLKVKGEQLKTKTKSDVADKYIKIAEDIVSTAVTTVNQTFTEQMKKSGKFDEVAAKTAFTLAGNRCAELISKDAVDAINAACGDFSPWLEAKIESCVNKNKITVLTPLIDTAIPDPVEVKEVVPTPEVVVIQIPTPDPIPASGSEFYCYGAKSGSPINPPPMPIPPKVVEPEPIPATPVTPIEMCPTCQNRKLEKGCMGCDGRTNYVQEQVEVAM